MIILTTDIDYIFNENHPDIKTFTDYWNSLLDRSPQPVLIYNTNKSISKALSFLRSRNMPEPDFFISDYGSIIYSKLHGGELEQWSNYIRKQHDRDEELRNQDEASSEKEQLMSKTYQHNGSIRVSRKSNALNWLRHKHISNKMPSLVVGYRESDLAMYKAASEYGIVVSDADAALRDIANPKRCYLSPKQSLFGLIDGITHFSDVIESNSYSSVDFGEGAK